MPAAAPRSSEKIKRELRALGQRLRAERKRLKLSATAVSEAAGLARMTLYRIELGEPAVTMGAYLAVISALGLKLEAVSRKRVRKTALPAAIRVAEYPQLRRLAWQLRQSAELSPREALDIYERNWRHVDERALSQPERELVTLLATAFGHDRLLV